METTENKEKSWINSMWNKIENGAKTAKSKTAEFVKNNGKEIIISGVGAAGIALSAYGFSKLRKENSELREKNIDLSARLEEKTSEMNVKNKQIGNLTYHLGKSKSFSGEAF